MSLVKKVDLAGESRADIMAKEFLDHLNTFHSYDVRPNVEVEKLLLKQQEFEVAALENKKERPHRYVFSPSGTSKCRRELYYRLKGNAPIEKRFPYQKRWTNNSTAIHARVQKDLLYAERAIFEPKFEVLRLENGLPAWEENLKNYVIVKHNNVEFAIQGMMDGILVYKDGTKVGFEFKTKSNTNAQVGNYLMKDVADSHKLQAVAYSLLFGVNEFLFLYEAVAKDTWSKGAEARPDIRVFYYKVNEEDKQMVLDKFADVVQYANEGQEPPREEDKCTFCTYKHLCFGGDK